MEQHYVFIKDGRVANIAVFAEQNEELADRVAQEQGYDDAVWVGSNIPAMFSSYNGEKFVAPTLDYLYEIGVALENTAMQAERAAKEQAEQYAINDPNSVI
jgi:acyl CoA:acetate/3-ketoacid CoA transferase beta subunit